MGVDLNKAESIFLAALRLPEEERLRYIERGCGGDDKLRRQIERLIVAQPEAESFLEHVDNLTDAHIYMFDHGGVNSHAVCQIFTADVSQIVPMRILLPPYPFVGSLGSMGTSDSSVSVQVLSARPISF